MKTNKLSAAIVSAALLASPTFAADTSKTPLPPGQPAGVQKAALGGLSAGTVILIGVGIIAIIAVAGGFNDSSTSGTSS
ncbi:MAG: hypothetical protein JO256_01585 [Alphaproteobacteria bacterium]|nr:hypothetical protein [Alphaproteobacteria bacterium]